MMAMPESIDRPPLRWQDIREGDALPTLEVPLTASVIVAGAIASRDFMPVHHDKDYANAQGAPDVFMNILTTNGYVSRYVTDWAGREARIEKIAIRLGAPALPGTSLVFNGRVTSTREGPANAATGEVQEGRVEIELQGTTRLGEHVTGRVVLTLPVQSSD